MIISCVAPAATTTVLHCVLCNIEFYRVKQAGVPRLDVIIMERHVHQGAPSQARPDTASDGLLVLWSFNNKSI